MDEQHSRVRESGSVAAGLTGYWSSRTSMWVLLLLLVAAGFLVRFWGLTHRHFWDEDVYLLNAKRFMGVHVGYDEIASRPPLLPLLFAGVLHLWHSDYATEALTALLNALGALFLFLAGRRVGSRTSAALAALLFAFSPFIAGVCLKSHGRLIPDCNGHSLLTDCPAVTLIILALWLGFEALRRESALRFLPVGFVLSLSVLMRFGSLASAGIFFLMPLAVRRRWLALLSCGAGFLLGFGPFLLWSRIQYGGFFAVLTNAWSNFSGPVFPPWYYLGILPQMLTWAGVGGLVLWMVRRIRDWRRAASEPGFSVRNLLRPEALPELFLSVWVVAAAIFYSSLGHKEPRYILPVAPPLLLLAGLGLETVTMSANNRLRWTGRAALAVALAVVFWPLHYRFDSGFIDGSVSEEMTLSRWLKRNANPAETIYANQNYPDIAYYSGFTVSVLPDGGPALTEALKAMPAGSLLVAYRANDDGEDVRVEPEIEALDRNPRYQRLTEMGTLVLYRVRR